MLKIYHTENLIKKIEAQTILEFSESLYNCTSIEQLRLILRNYLKQLIHFEVFRISIGNHSDYYTFTFAGNEVIFSKTASYSLMETELNMLEINNDYSVSGIKEPFFRNMLKAFPVRKPISKGLILKQGKRKILVSLVHQENDNLSDEQIIRLKQFINAFSGRFNELLIELQLREKQQQLEKAQQVIATERKKIVALKHKEKELLEGQQQVIKKNNEKLLLISVLTSHHLREPLTRVQGLLSLFDFTDEKEQKNALIPKLNTSVNEMDSILKRVVKMMSKEIKQII